MSWRPEPWWLLFGAFGGMAVGALAGLVGTTVALAAVVTFAVGLLVAAIMFVGGDEGPMLGDAAPLLLPSVAVGAGFAAWMAGPIRNRPTVRKA